MRSAEMTARPRIGGGCDDVAAVVHAELAQLPSRYREAVVLCLLDGLTPEQAAPHLNCPVGTVHSRLARGRGMLAKRLARRGFAGAPIAAALTDGALSLRVERTTCSNSYSRTFVRRAGNGGQDFFLSQGDHLNTWSLDSMVLIKVKSTIRGFTLSRDRCPREPRWTFCQGSGNRVDRGTIPDMQEKSEVSPDDLRDGVGELKQQLEQMQKKIAKLEQAKQPGHGWLAWPRLLAGRFQATGFRTRTRPELEGGSRSRSASLGCVPRGDQRVWSRKAIRAAAWLAYPLCVGRGCLGADREPRLANHSGGQAGGRVCARSRHGRARLFSFDPHGQGALFTVLRGRVFRNREQCLAGEAVN